MRQSTELLEEFHIFSTCWWTRTSLRSSHLKIWTLFLLAVIWRWDGSFGGSDAFFALLRVVPELSASFSGPSMAKSSLPSRAPMPISIAFVDIHIRLASARVQNNNNNNNNNTIWGGSVLTGEEPPPHSGELKHALTQAGGPTQSQLSRPMSSGHHISMEHRLRRKQLNSHTNASSKKYLKEIQEKRQEQTFFFGKMKKRK